jgi:hypothetical protein
MRLSYICSHFLIVT